MTGMLRPQHAERLAAFRIPLELREAAGVRSVTDAEARDQFGIVGPGDMGGLIFPYLDPISGRRVTARLRRDHPEVVSGKPDRKYISAFGDARHLYFPPGAGELLGNASVPVVFVEAEKSSLALTALAARTGQKSLVIATGGCWGWRGKKGIAGGPTGERKVTCGPLPNLDRITWPGRKVIIAFDSNVASNHNVRAARRAFAQELTARGADVWITDLPVHESASTVPMI
jgi:hypothetical protein